MAAKAAIGLKGLINIEHNDIPLIAIESPKFKDTR